MSVLVFNAGSSTLKFSVFSDALAEGPAGVLDWKRDPGQADVTFGERREHLPMHGIPDALTHVLRLLDDAGLLQNVRACGHRVVHGGARFRASVRIDAAVKQQIRDLGELAPLHNPPALAGIEAAEAALPNVPQVAVFDTAFFAEQPPESFLYPVPYAWYADWGIRRFGFHGISHQYCATRAGELLGRADLRLVICHLGNGCSASAVHAGRAVTSTMGYTPLEGLMMGTRSGSVDPGILLHLLQKEKLTVAQLDDALLRQSGLLGVSGVSSDFREVQRAADTGHERAALALRLYADRVRSAVGSLAVTLGGLDALVFTAGVGANSAWLRREVCRGLECLGLLIDDDANQTKRPDADVARDDSPGRILIVQTREELLIARETRRLTDVI